MWANMSEKRKAETNAKRSKAMKKKYGTRKQKKVISARKKKMHADMTAKQKKQVSKKISQAAQSWWAAATPEMIAARSRKRAETMANKSKKEKQRVALLKSEKMKAHWANKTKR